MAGELKSPTSLVSVQEAEGPGLLDYLGMFRRRLKTILFPAVLMALLGGLVAFILPNQYEATTKFVVNDVGTAKEGLGGGGMPPHKPLLVRAEDEMKSPAFLRPIIDSIGISEGYNVTRPDEFSELLDYIDDNLRVRLDKAPQGADRILIVYQGRNQAKVVEFVDAVRESYRDLFRDQYRRQPREWYNSAVALVQNIERQLTTKQVEMQAHAATPDVGLLNRGPEYRREAEDLRSDRDERQRELTALNLKLARAQNQLRELPAESVRRRFVENEAKKEARAKYDAALKILNELVEYRKLLDTTDEVKRARAEVDRLKKNLDALDDRIEQPSEVAPNDQRQALQLEILNYRREIEAQEEQVRAAGRRLAELNDLLRRIPEIEARDERLKGEIEALQLRLERAQRARQDAEGTWVRVKDAELFRVLEYPHGNDPPVFPSMPLFILIGAAAGFFIGLGVAFLKEFSGMTYATSAQVKHAMTLPILGEVSRIVSEDERRRESAKRWRTITIVGLVLTVLGMLHLFYFHPDLAGYLPTKVGEVMDKIYLGR
ncbi:MAG: Wzz/FepE/Etk N-terminal domain-containing protein [Planctomycetota bacterium]